MKVALAQINVKLGNVTKNVEKMEKYIDIAINDHCDLIMFPELATSGYILRDLVSESAISFDDKILKNIKTKSRAIDIMFGYNQKDNDYFYNSAMYIHDEELVFNHKKVFLPDYGMFEEARYFTKGSQIKSFNSVLGKSSIVICEDMFHITTHCKTFEQNIDFLIIASASPFWMDSNSIKPDMWQSILRNYSLLTCSYTFFVNRVGFEDGVCFFGSSFIVNPFGEIIDSLNLCEEDILIANVDKTLIEISKKNFPIMKNEVCYETDR